MTYLTEAQYRIIDRCARGVATAEEGNNLRWIIYGLEKRVARAERERADTQAELWEMQGEAYEQARR